jgi:hypothetical protein
MMAQTILLNKIMVRFCIYKDTSDKPIVYNVTKNFKFRSYDMTNIGECDFYDISLDELTLIAKHSIRV